MGETEMVGIGYGTCMRRFEMVGSDVDVFRKSNPESLLKYIISHRSGRCFMVFLLHLIKGFELV